MDKKGIFEYQDDDRVSGQIFYDWLIRSGVSRKTILNEINLSDTLVEKIGMKTFQQWTSDNESSKKIGAKTIDEMGNRVVAIIQWFTKEHLHRKNRILKSEEMEKLINIYENIPIRNRLQLKKILHDLKVANGEIETKLPIDADWKKQLNKEPLCAFVLDKYWCLRATTHYELAFAGYDEKDVKDWGCWHRLAASMGGVPKHTQDSPMSKTRGPYAREYYIKQMTRFRYSVADFLRKKDERLQAVLDLLNETPAFQEIWDLSIQFESEHLANSIGFPVPFFRKDGTLLWMRELSTVISNTDGFNLIIWTPMDRDSSMYLAELCKSVDESGKFSQKCYFVEDYAPFFSEKQRFALGI